MTSSPLLVLKGLMRAAAPPVTTPAPVPPVKATAAPPPPPLGIPRYLDELFKSDPDLARHQLDAMKQNDPARFAQIVDYLLDVQPLRRGKWWLAWAKREAAALAAASPAAALAKLKRQMTGIAPEAAPILAPAPRTFATLERLDRAHTITRREAAERLAALLRERGYTAEVDVPKDSGVVRVTVDDGKGGTRGRYWILLDGRLRSADANERPGRFRDETPALEELANEALAGFRIAAETASEFTVGTLSVTQSDAGAYVVHDFSYPSPEFTTRSEAERYARAIGDQHPATFTPLVVPASAGVPTARTGTDRQAGLPYDPDGGSVEVRYDLANAQVPRWASGAPVVTVPFAMYRPDGTPATWPDDGTPRRGLFIASESVDRQGPGHFSYLRRWDGADMGQSVDGNDADFHHPVLARLVRLVPAQSVGFDGARVEVRPDEILVQFDDDDPGDDVRHALRRGKFTRAKARATWHRDRSDDADAWWWARRAAWLVQHGRAYSTARDRHTTPSSRQPRSHDAYRTREVIAASRHDLNDSELHAGIDFRKELRKLTPETIAATDAVLDRLLRKRAEFVELDRLYRSDGTRRPVTEPVPEPRDMTAPFPSGFVRVAAGIDIAERDGRLVVRLAAEPAEEFERTLHAYGLTRSRRRGEELWWAQPFTRLGRYFAHQLAERQSRHDAEDREQGFRHRFKVAIPDDQTWMPDPAAVAPTAAPPVLAIGLTALDKIARLASEGKDLAAWETEAREALKEAEYEHEADRDLAVSTVRGWLPVHDGRITDDAWLDAYRHALHGTDRRILLAARLYADQPLVAGAAVLARARRHENTRITLEELAAAVVPADVPVAARQRVANALMEALAQLGLVELEAEEGPHRRHRDHRLYRDGVRARLPPRVAPAWGWLLRFEMVRTGRTHPARDEAVTRSLATRLLGYDETTAAWALERAARQGWIAVEGDTVMLPSGPAPTPGEDAPLLAGRDAGAR
jgi:hypothetical protein